MGRKPGEVVCIGTDSFNWCRSAPQWNAESVRERRSRSSYVSIGAGRHLNGTSTGAYAVNKKTLFQLVLLSTSMGLRAMDDPKANLSACFNWCHSAPQWDGTSWFCCPKMLWFQLVPLGTSMGRH